MHTPCTETLISSAAPTMAALMLRCGWVVVALLLTRASASLDYSKRAALCMSGQLRTFLETYESLGRLRRSFPGETDIFMFVSRNESYRKSLGLAAHHGTHAPARDAAAIASLAPVAVEYYESSRKRLDRAAGPGLADYEAEAPPVGDCHRNPSKPTCCHFSHHGPQFWSIGRCLDLVRGHERRLGVRYGWAARIRPDALYGKKQFRIVRRITGDSAIDVEAPRAWYRSSARSDAFAIMTRGAMDAYSSIWRDEFHGNNCARIGLAHKPDDALLNKVCGPFGVRYKYGTECMVTAHLVLRYGVNVTAHDYLTPRLVRPGDAPPGRRRR